MLAVPLLADFCVRLAFGLLAALLLTSPRDVPLRFFRIQTVVVLGVLVLAGLDQARAVGAAPALWLVVAGAILSYLATVAFGLGLARMGTSMGILTATVASVWMAGASHSAPAGLWALNAFSRAASGFLMGATLTAMLLGHYYLIAPAMTIEPLKRAVTMIALGMAGRCLLAGITAWVRLPEPFGSGIGQPPAGTTLLAARWIVGFAAAAVSVFMARRTVAIRSTQSATGILYITTIFVLFGELTSMIEARDGILG